MPPTLLEQIQNEAVDHKSDLPSLLRKCRVLAQRLGNDDLKNWVICELDGYPNFDDTPDYRIFSKVLLLGHYFGAFSSEIKNVQIAHSSIDERIRDKITTVSLYQGVKQLEHDKHDHKESGCLKVTVQPEALKYIENYNVRQDMQLGDMVKIVTTSMVDGVLETVRNKILNFTLELESESEKSGIPISDMNQENPEKVQQIFNTEIKGNVSNYSAGGSSYTQTVNIEKGNIDDLKAYFESIGLGQDDISEFEEALITETTIEKGSFGTKVNNALSKAVAKAGEGLLSIPGGVAGGLITQALNSYYGI